MYVLQRTMYRAPPFYSSRCCAMEYGRRYSINIITSRVFYVVAQHRAIVWWTCVAHNLRVDRVCRSVYVRPGEYWMFTNRRKVCACVLWDVVSQNLRRRIGFSVKHDGHNMAAMATKCQLKNTIRIYIISCSLEVETNACLEFIYSVKKINQVWSEYDEFRISTNIRSKTLFYFQKNASFDFSSISDGNMVQQ